MPAKGSASWERRYGFTHWASAGCALRREAWKSGGRLAVHTAGRLSEQGLCIPGAEKIDVLKADLESAEWKVLENLILEDVLEQIGQLIFEIHLHWPGFEVSGSESSVVRFWYSLLKELEQKDFRLFHTYKDLSKPQLFLKKDILNASSCYTLSWVNTRWK
ncbi:probable methyltransferase-like protein 24 [Alexandromys fortis]|uniref:probable methyltransferase-like protein 24 n=1 Tax=Alexandromys fortis TaxID=100897 RepID=UPI0021535A8E|nr:probable methyltransferase-like protein 24 [Microtus fortis]